MPSASPIAGLRALLLCALLLPGLYSQAQKPTTSQVLHTAQGLVETGVLDGAAYRIDIPGGWNGGLVMYYHGYAQTVGTFHIQEKIAGHPAPLLERHYAIAQSSYSLPGWALPQAYPETESLRKYFVHKYGPPKETYVVGSSMGGALVMVTLELNPRPYLGGLDLCGAVGPTIESFERRFSLRAAFDYYFPNVAPPILQVPPDYLANEAEREKIAAALRRNPAGAEAMRNLMGLHSDAGVASDIAYFTYVIGDMTRRAGGNPFDNRNLLYTGSNPADSKSDFALNDGVRRYAAQPKARQYLVRHYTPSGRLQKPMLAVHTLYDPIVQPGSLAQYDHLVQAAGFGENLVQQYVKHEGHCAISPDEILHAFDELVDWTHGGSRPEPGPLRGAEKPEKQDKAAPADKPAATLARFERPALHPRP
ncbi:MAG: alpha/beta hydrolase [Acidobacteriaceae bacterium]|nr:alpha/beta hydrolase [Acidobacteriaceae bacterium]